MRNFSQERRLLSRGDSLFIESVQVPVHDAAVAVGGFSADGALVVRARSVAGFEGLFLGKEFSQRPVFGAVRMDEVGFDSGQGPTAVGGHGELFTGTDVWPGQRRESRVQPPLDRAICA